MGQPQHLCWIINGNEEFNIKSASELSDEKWRLGITQNTRLINIIIRSNSKKKQKKKYIKKLMF